MNTVTLTECVRCYETGLVYVDVLGIKTWMRCSCSCNKEQDSRIPKISQAIRLDAVEQKEFPRHLFRPSGENINEKVEWWKAQKEVCLAFWTNNKTKEENI